MKIDRDNFRHLTGFGRDMANYVGRAFSNVLSTNCLHVMVVHDKNKNTVRHKFLSVEETAEIFAKNPYADRYDIDFDVNGSHNPMLLIYVVSGNLCESVGLPVYMLHPSWHACYHLYRHTFYADQNNDYIKNAIYTGVTKCGWRSRWTQHLRAARSGSNTLFHHAIRNWYGVAKIMTHDIVGSAMSETKAMEMEELLVARDSLQPLGLNMIPGGYAGIAHLRNLGVLGKHERVSVDDVDNIINRFCERKGIFNASAAANWLNPAYAEKVICGGDNRLKPQQIREARLLSSFGQDIDTIVSRVGARNVAQVERLLSGQTYSRIQ